VNNVVTKISTPYSTGHIPCPYGCGRSFKHATQKAIHIRKVHTGERPFVCKVEGCGKAFYSSGDLKSHEKTHSGLKPFECPTCGKALSSRNALKVHIKALHTLERPFKCEVPNCGMTYMTRLDLDRHMKKHVKWEQKEEKAKMANLEKRTEKAERKLRQVLEKQVKNQSGEARVSVNLSAGRLVALAPGEPPPEGAVAYFVPNANGAGMPLDKLDVTYARGKYRRGSSKSTGGDGTSGMEPSSSLLSREGEEGDGDDPTVQGATDALKSRAHRSSDGKRPVGLSSDGIGGAFSGLLASGSVPGVPNGAFPPGGLSASGAFANLLAGGDANQKTSPNSLFGGNFGALTPTGLSFGGLQLPSPNASGHLNVDLGSMDLPSPVARALAAGAGAAMLGTSHGGKDGAVGANGANGAVGATTTRAEGPGPLVGSRLGPRDAPEALFSAAPATAEEAAVDAAPVDAPEEKKPLPGSNRPKRADLSIEIPADDRTAAGTAATAGAGETRRAEAAATTDVHGGGDGRGTKRTRSASLSEPVSGGRSTRSRRGGE